MSSLQGQTLSPGFFDPLNDTSLEVTIPEKKDVNKDVVANQKSVVVKFVSAMFSSSQGCACAKKKIQKIYSY